MGTTVVEDANGTTRQRLLQAAGEVFASRGFRGATVREICSRAKVNVAAVNYHFRDKQSLYAAALQYAHRYAMESYPPEGGVAATAPAEQRLEGFVRAFLCRLLDPGRPAWHGVLMIRELMAPTGALDYLVNESIRPNFELLAGIITDLLGPAGDDVTRVRLCSSSVIGQCMHFRLSKEVLTRLNQGLVYDRETIEGIVQHVVRFSLAAMADIREAGRERAERGRRREATDGDGR